MNPIAIWKIAKIVGPIIIVGLLILGIRSWHNGQLHVAYNKGILDEKNRISIVIEKQNDENRRLESSIKDAMDVFSEQLASKAVVRDTKQLGIIKEIQQETIKENTVYTNCLADPAVLARMNELRALGPVDEKANP